MAVKPILIWDWDDTLVETLEYKYGGIWNVVFSDDIEKQHAAIIFVKTPEGRLMNRYGLICHALISTGSDEVANLSDSECKKHPQVIEAASRYDCAAKAFVYKNGLRDGAHDTLEKLFSDSYSMYLVSGGGTDDDLQEMTIRLSIDKYFKGIFGFGSLGASLTRFGKQENFARVMKMETDDDTAHYTVIGDSETDYSFAEKVRSRFIGIVTKLNGWRVGKEPFPVVAAIADIPQQLMQNR